MNQLDPTGRPGGWPLRGADGVFNLSYDRYHSNREAIAESFVPYLAVRQGAGQSTSGQRVAARFFAAGGFTSQLPTELDDAIGQDWGGTSVRKMFVYRRVSTARVTAGV